MKYDVEFYKGGQFLYKQNVTVPGKIEYLEKLYGEECGATVQVKNSEKVHVKFWAGKQCKDEIVEIYKGIGSVYWEAEAKDKSYYSFYLQIVIRKDENQY